MTAYASLSRRPAHRYHYNNDNMLTENTSHNNTTVILGPNNSTALGMVKEGIIGDLEGILQVQVMDGGGLLTEGDDNNSSSTTIALDKTALFLQDSFG